MPFLDSKIELFYRPVINPIDEQVMIYRVIPVLTAPDGTQKTGAKQVLAHDGNPLETAARNAIVLQQAGLALQAAHKSGNCVFVMFPINAKALSTKESTYIMVQALKSLPSVCAKAAISHVFDLPDRVNLSTLDDVVIPLLITIDKFVLEPPADLQDYTDISGCNAQGVVLDLDPIDGSGLDLTKFWSRAAPRRLGLFVQNIMDEELVVQIQRFESRGMDGALFGDLLPAIGPRTTRSALKS